MPRLRLLLLGLALLAVVVYAGATHDGTWAQDSGPNRAGIVILFGNGEAYAQCVSFSEPSISGYELLNRLRDYGVVPVAWPRVGMGAAVCKISDARRQNGCDYPADDCFCQCTNPSGNCQYWAYYHQQNGAWVYSDVGGGGWQITNGMVDGWAWGAGELNRSGAVPPLLSFDQICVPTEPSPSPTPTPTTQPTLTPTPTFTPTSTSTFTPTPTLTPTPTGTVFTATPTPTGLFTATPAPATSTPLPTSTVALAVSIEFSAQPETIGVGSCTTLRWIVQNADAAFLKVGEAPEESVAPSSALNVCPTQDTGYTLRGVRGSVQQGRSLVVQVIAAGTPLRTPILTATLPATEMAATPIAVELETATPTSSPVPALAAAVTPAGASPPGSGAVARPVPIFTPAPTASDSKSSASIFLGVGGFALLLAVVSGAGLWALSRQTSTRRPPLPPSTPPDPPAAP